VPLRLTRPEGRVPSIWSPSGGRIRHSRGEASSRAAIGEDSTGYWKEHLRNGGARSIGAPVLCDVRRVPQIGLAKPNNRCEFGCTGFRIDPDGELTAGCPGSAPPARRGGSPRGSRQSEPTGIETRSVERAAGPFRRLAAPSPSPDVTASDPGPSPSGRAQPSAAHVPWPNAGR
jgi:hypothetical protein